jgi:hypothetical protein
LLISSAAHLRARAEIIGGLEEGMQLQNPLAPATAGAVGQHQGAEVGRHCTQANIITASPAQHDRRRSLADGADFAARVIAARYQLAPHVAALVAALAGLGGGRR